MDYKTISTTSNILEDFSKICKTNGPLSEEEGKKILFFVKNIQQIFLRKPINTSNQTALLYFITHKDFDIALKLVKIDTNYDIHDNEGDTPLMLVTGYENEITISIAKEILKGNCLIKHINKKKENIVIACSKYSTIPSLKILKMVLDVIEEQELDINIVFQIDIKNKSSLDYLLHELIEAKNGNRKEEWDEKLHVKTIVRIFNMYKDANKYDDENFNNIIKVVCETEILFDIFNKPLDLNRFCSAPENAEAIIPMAEISNSPYRKSTKRASVRPIAFAQPITPEHTNPNNHFAFGRDHLYQPVPNSKRIVGGKYSRKIKKRS